MSARGHFISNAHGDLKKLAALLQQRMIFEEEMRRRARPLSAFNGCYSEMPLQQLLSL